MECDPCLRFSFQRSFLFFWFCFSPFRAGAVGVFRVMFCGFFLDFLGCCFFFLFFVEVFSLVGLSFFFSFVLVVCFGGGGWVGLVGCLLSGWGGVWGVVDLFFFCFFLHLEGDRPEKPI